MSSSTDAGAAPFADPTFTPSQITTFPVPFSTLPNLSCYASHYAVVFDNVLTPAECTHLLTSLPPTPWDAAARCPNPTFRNSQRVMLDSQTATTDLLLSRLSPYLPSKLDPTSNALILGKDATRPFSKARGESGYWELVGLNERLRYLRYEQGQFFRPHCDGAYAVEGGKEKAFLTLQLYLSGDEDAQGGETRFLSEDRKGWWDCEPKRGRVVVFQQRGLWHEGREVRNGVKVTMRTDLMYRPVVIGREETKRRREEEAKRVRQQDEEEEGRIE